MNEDNKVKIWKMFFITIAIFIIFSALSIIFFPKEYTIRLETDDNARVILEKALNEVADLDNSMADFTDCKELQGKRTIYAYNVSLNSYYEIKQDFTPVWDCG